MKAQIHGIHLTDRSRVFNLVLTNDDGETFTIPLDRVSEAAATASANTIVEAISDAMGYDPVEWLDTIEKEA